MLNKSAVIYVSLGIDLHFYQVIMTFVRYHSTDSKKTNKSAIIHTMEWLWNYCRSVSYRCRNSNKPQQTYL